MTPIISITGLTINSSNIIINYTNEHNFKPNTKRGLVIGPSYSSDEHLILPFNKGNIKWFYNYKLDIKGNKNQIDIEFVPKIWGTKIYNDALDPLWDNPNNYKSIMSFNEPYYKAQSNLTTDEIVSRWSNVQQIAKGMRLGLVSLTGNSTQIINQINTLKEKGLPMESIDFIELHIMIHNAQNLDNIITNIYKAFKKPIWLTEFNCHHYDKNHTPKYYFCKGNAQYNFLKAALPLLEKNPYVERYAWFTTEPVTTNESNKPDTLLKHKSEDLYELTRLGKFYNEYVYTE